MPVYSFYLSYLSYLSILSSCLSLLIYLCIHLSVYLLTCLSICLPNYLPIISFLFLRCPCLSNAGVSCPFPSIHLSLYRCKYSLISFFLHISIYITYVYKYMMHERSSSLYVPSPVFVSWRSTLFCSNMFGIIVCACLDLSIGFHVLLFHLSFLSQYVMLLFSKLLNIYCYMLYLYVFPEK